MGGCKGPITTFIVEPFIPHNEEFYINIVSERLGCSISFSECGGIDIEENWEKVHGCICIRIIIHFTAGVVTLSFLRMYRWKQSFYPQGYRWIKRYVLHLLPPSPWRWVITLLQMYMWLDVHFCLSNTCLFHDAVQICNWGVYHKHIFHIHR